MSAAEVHAFAAMICHGAAPMFDDIISEEDDRDLAELTNAELIDELLLADADEADEDVSEYRGEILRRMNGEV